MPASKTPENDEKITEWKGILEKLDKEMRDKGLSDDDRERLIKEILEDDGKG